MTIAEIFYLTATIVLIIVGVSAIYIAYQVYRLIGVVKMSAQKAKNVVSMANSAKKSAQFGIIKFLINLLGGDEDD